MAGFRDVDVDRSWQNEIRNEMLTERLNNLKDVGPLLDDKARGPLEAKIQMETNLPLPAVKDIVDTINGTVGTSLPPSTPEKLKEQTISEIKEILQDNGITNPKFLDRVAKDIAKVLEAPMQDREKRIEGLKMAPAAPAVSAPAISAPALGSKS